MPVCINSIWEEFSTPLRSFIKRRVQNEQDAEDILQEVFLKIHSSIESLKDDSRIHGWIYRITRNAIVDYYRGHENSVASIDFLEDMAAETDEDSSSNGEIAACLKSMINNLPEKYREAIILTEFQNLTQKELSEKLGLSVSGAKSRVQRAREKLKEMLLSCCQFEFDRLGNIIDYKHNNCDCKYC